MNKRLYGIILLLMVLLAAYQTHSRNRTMETTNRQTAYCREQIHSSIAIRMLAKPHRALAFVSQKGGQIDLWLAESDGSNFTRLTEDDWVERDPVWSLDGTRLAWRAFFELNGKTMYQVLIADFTSRSVYCVLDEPVDYVSPPFWISDGRQLGIVVNGTGVVYDLATVSQEELFQDLIALEPVWSPDGNMVAMPSSECLRSMCVNLLKVFSANGLELTLHRPDGGDWFGVFSGIAWSSDSSELLVSTVPSRWNLAGELAIVTVNSQQVDAVRALNPLEDECRVYESDVGCSYYSPSWSPDETQVLFTSPIHSPEKDLGEAVYVMSSDSSKAHLVACERQFCRDPVWSPDGAQIAFTVETPSPGRNSDADIWIVNNDGSGIYALTDNNWYDGEPVWQP
jgi:Tol biopolymer transport system component